jgi:hypothetical protein
MPHPQRRAARRLPLVLAAAAALLAPAAAHAAPTLEFASLVAIGYVSGWRLYAELEGSTDVASAALKPPGRPAFALGCRTDPEITECEFESAEAASLGALLALYPSGNWQLSLNGGVRTATLPFAPVAPNGLVTVTSPLDGAVGVSPTPTITWVHDCSNCVALSFDLVGLEVPFEVGLEALLFGTPSPGSLPYALLESYRGPKPAALPDGRYALAAATAVGSVQTRTLTPGGAAFEYTSGALRAVESTFRVPEPGPIAAGAAAAGALAAAARRRRPS